MAAACGVSVGTVSYALNGKGRVDADTRTRIRETADRLGYVANQAARGLRSGRTATLGLLMPTPPQTSSRELLSLDWHSQVAVAAADAAFRADHALLLLPAPQDPAQLLRHPVDGIIVTDPARDDPRLPVLAGLGLPLVALGQGVGGLVPNYVTADAESTTRQMLDHLAQQGATRIQLLVPDAGWEWTRLSVSAYRYWCGEHDHAPTTTLVGLAGTSTETGLADAAHRAALQTLSAPDRPDALLALCLGFGVGASRAAQELGLRVPDDLLIAQDLDEPSLQSTDPPITAADMHPRLQAKAAVDMLLSLLDGNHPPSPVITPVDLHLRASTDRTPTKDSAPAVS
ncbi:LacI family DNA-binding transcriptional regulator [Streptomyces sp. NPDC004667]|uniref:LacI family DNA-binding transcriptional regulator n=1 Tax=Streptomyces sp. NPDC004667 TaxID=3154285 RepID=UPI0033B14D02